ncbi:hypothetical protein BDV59DRAFT_184443 [Aspergillus ambiguus]|uniref:25S rRNA (uracil2634-N3)-methyltransferase n=1 Tax=Aspergillus ambiguus TaxID=176160 RepID=UPI003CCCFAF9
MEGDDDGDDVEEDEWEWEENGSGGSGSESESPQEEEKNEGTRRRTDPGQILVSMFEGEPYTLWNIKDLARHAGLRVVTSFRFPWSSYKGYAHARTIGEIEGKHGGRGGWRGEDREARMYVFEVKGNEQGPRSSNGAKGKSKRARQASDSDESD